MKKIILTAAIMLASVGAYAQHAVGSINLQPKVGMNIATLTDYDNAKARIGLAAGLELEYQASDIFSLSIGGIYSMQGVKREWTTGNKEHSKTTKLDYINVPIMANVYVANGLAVKLGVQPGFKVNSEITEKTTERKVIRRATMDPEIESFDFSIPVGISYEVSNLQIDARYNWGLTKVFKNRDYKNSVFQITLGYKFEL
ncbi:porin family protein [Prevotella falsenii]|uniref:porin family protein n=1 Tax=Prevotella falsenii TaxID=515414 RepID=UPI0004693F59|nr:porin family protein [Prevotella falsenii]